MFSICIFFSLSFFYSITVICNYKLSIIIELYVYVEFFAFNCTLLHWIHYTILANFWIQFTSQSFLYKFCIFLNLFVYFRNFLVFLIIFDSLLLWKRIVIVKDVKYTFYNIRQCLRMLLTITTCNKNHVEQKKSVLNSKLKFQMHANYGSYKIKSMDAWPLYAWPCKPQTIEITWRWNICKIWTPYGYERIFQLTIQTLWLRKIITQIEPIWNQTIKGVHMESNH